MKIYWQESKPAISGSCSYHHTPSMTAKSAYFYVQEAGYFRCGSDYYTRREGYRSILLINTIAGSGHARYRNREYDIGPGQALLMNCYEFQEYRTGKDGFWEMQWVHFYGGTSEEYYNIIYDRHGPVIDIREKPGIGAVLDEILKLAGESEILPEARVSLLIVRMLTELLGDADDMRDGACGKPVDEHVQRALEYIDANYSNSITLTDLARYSCCSEFHFSRLFKKTVGYSPYEYIVKFRINKAKKLLKNTDAAVAEIAESVGFGSASNFIRTFRELEGMTPLKYRRYWN